jgi:hypothetical protein
MRRVAWWAILIFGVGIFALIFYHAWQRMRASPTPQPAPPSAASPAAPPAKPEIRFPIGAEPPEKPLPALDDSDATVAEALGDMWDAKTLAELLHLGQFIRRAVATIDSLPRAKLALRLMPVKPAAGPFLVSGTDDRLTTNPGNAARYAPYVRLAESMDAKRVVAVYARFYPLFQQAYQELGFPDGYFNDRLVEVIDHLLAAPEIGTPPRLVRPKVFYLYEDPELEARSAGQKILMRIGTDNATRIKAKLRELRGELTRSGSRTAE